MVSDISSFSRATSTIILFINIDFNFLSKIGFLNMVTIVGNSWCA